MAARAGAVSALVVVGCCAQAVAAGDVAVMLRGSSIGEGERELANALGEALADKPAWVPLVVYASIAVGGIVLLMALACCVRCVCCPRPAVDKAMLANPYPNSWDSQLGGRTLVRKNDLRPAPALADFMRANPSSSSSRSSYAADDYDLDAEEPPPPPASAAAAAAGSSKDPAGRGVVPGMSKRVSTNLTGNDYGRLNPEAKARIASVRLEADKLQPFGVAKPSSKALKMLGVEESAIERPFDEDITTRMERLAQNAGGGLYSPGLATAKLGNQIAAGFKDRRAKQLEKARVRKEKEEARRRAREEEKAAQSVASSTASKPAKPKPAPPPQELKPGPARLKAFLSKTTFEDDDDEEDEE